MVCYARPAAWLAVIVAVAWLVFARPAGHFFDTAALAAAVTVAIAGAAISAALVIAVFMSVRRRRAAAGGCVTCQFRCQHAMTAQPSRRWLAATADRGRQGSTPIRSVPVLLPMPTVRPAMTGTTPRWPDRPLYRVSAPGPDGAGPAGRSEHRVRDAAVTPR